MHPDIEKALVTPTDFKSGNYFNKSWTVFWQAPWYFVGALIVWGLISGALRFIPFVGDIASMLIYPIQLAGIYIAVRKLLNNQPIEFDDFFKGFQFGGKLILPYILHVIMIIIGCVLLVLPGIYLAVAYTFVIPLALFYEEDAWSLLEASRKIVSKKWWSFLGFFFLILLFNLAGLLCLGVGLLVTIPVTMITTYIIFEDFLKPGTGEGFTTNSGLLDSDI